MAGKRNKKGVAKEKMEGEGKEVMKEIVMKENERARQ